MLIKIKYKHTTYKVEVPDGTTITRFKEILSKMEPGISPDQQKLVLKGKILPDDHIINENIKNLLLFKIKKPIDVNKIIPCINSCGFYGNYLSNWYCSRCYQELNKKDSTSSTESLENISDSPKSVQTDSERCYQCDRKVRLLGFKCKCGYIFCSKHRAAENHDCIFDWKTWGKTHIIKSNENVTKKKIMDM